MKKLSALLMVLGAITGYFTAALENALSLPQWKALLYLALGLMAAGYALRKMCEKKNAPSVGARRSGKNEAYINIISDIFDIVNYKN